MGRRIAAAAWLAASLCVASTACDIPPDRELDGPVVLGSDPTDGETGADPGADLRVFFDRPIHPRDVRRGRVAVRSGERAVFLSAWFEPVDRVMHVVRLSGPLEPDTSYRLIVEGVRDLDRRTQPEPYVAAFRTAETSSGGGAAALASWRDVEPIFDRCAVEGCHGGSAPMLGLDLSSGLAIERTAVGVAAEQSRVGTQGDEVWPGASTLEGLARIDVVGGVGRPSRSYLLYKVLGDPHAAGQRMPPAPDAPLSADEMRLLSRWIRAGAPTL